MLNYILNYVNIETNLLVGEFKEYKETFKCCICLNIPISPECCYSCRNLYCNKCIESWCQTNTTCPTCREEYVSSKIDRLTNEFFSKIKLLCPFKNYGCNKQIKYEDFSNHIENCTCIIYKCINCKLEGSWTNLESHKCFFRCDTCLMQIEFKKKDIHVEKCIKFNKCRFCNKIVPNREIKFHVINECLEVDAVCKICGLVTKREILLEEHGLKECLSIINTKAHRMNKYDLLKKINNAVFEYSQCNTENSNPQNNSNINNSISIKYKQNAFISTKRARAECD